MFKKEFEFWQNFFNLKDWLATVVLTKIEDLAHLRWEDDVLSTRMVGVILDNHNNADDAEIIEAAFHEACELMFLPLRVMAVKAGADEEAIDAEVHRLITAFTNSVYKEMKFNNKYLEMRNV